ncbi:MAG: hypothetical protein ISQ88_06285 [Rhodobacteraceae bacterium]|nr:hypothetical protein [Paracoccaceae bacterium]
MDTQKNLMMFTPIVAIIFGAWFLFAPNTYYAVMGVDPTLITEFVTNNQKNIGVSLLVLAYINWILRGLSDSENCEKIMTTFCVGWAMFGIGGLYIVGGDFGFSNPFTIQSLIFIIISIIYYMLRAPKIA